MKEQKQITISDLQVSSLGAGERNVLLLHGGPGVYGYLEALHAIASSFCSSFYYEQRGSKQNAIALGISDHISDISLVIDGLSLDSQPILVGHSWGAMLAILFASRFPNFIQRLILIGCGPLNKSTGKEFSRELLTRFDDRREYFDDLWVRIENEKENELQQTLANAYINEIVPFYQNSNESISGSRRLEWDYQASIATMMESDEYVNSSLYESAVSRIQIPISVIQGSEDPLRPEFLFPVFARHHTEVELYRIEGTGHYPWIGDKKVEFSDILRQIVTKND